MDFFGGDERPVALRPERMPSGYMTSQTCTALSSSVNPGNGTAFFMPFWVTDPGGRTVTAIAIRTITTPGSAGAVHRLGIYKDDGVGNPGALVLDAGTVDETVPVGHLEIVINKHLDPGLYWLCAVPQGAPTTHATVVRFSTGLCVLAGASSVSALQPMWFAAGVTGALPNPAPAVSAVTNGTAVWLKIS
jgi:hypothetical protein